MNPNLFYPMISGMRDLLISALSTTKIKYLFLMEFVIRLVMMEKFGISNCVTKRDFPNCKCSGELSMCIVKGKKDKQVPNFKLNNKLFIFQRFWKILLFFFLKETRNDVESKNIYQITFLLKNDHHFSTYVYVYTQIL